MAGPLPVHAPRPLEDRGQSGRFPVEGVRRPQPAFPLGRRLGAVRHGAGSGPDHQRDRRASRGRREDASRLRPVVARNAPADGQRRRAHVADATVPRTGINSSWKRKGSPSGSTACRPFGPYTRKEDRSVAAAGRPKCSPWVATMREDRQILLVRNEKDRAQMREATHGGGLSGCSS